MATIRCHTITFQTIQAVLFDKDGTLAHSEPFLRHLALRRARLIDAQIPGVQDPLLMAFGVEGDRLNPAGLMAIGTRQENEIAAAAYVAETGRDWPDALKLVRSAFQEADQVMQPKADHTPLMAGARELLVHLTQAGVRVGILSADSPENVQEFVQTQDLGAYVTCHLGVEHGVSKTDPSLLQRAFAALDVFPEHTLMVGDSSLDIEIARRAEMAGCVGFTGGWATPASLPQADVAIDRLSLIQVVE